MATKAFSCPLDVRKAIRANRLTGFASRALPGYLCVNVVFMHRQYAHDFAAFCEANPKPCPLLFTTEPGQTDCPDLAEELDLCTDLGSYDIIRNGGVTEQRQDVVDLFDEDTVTFFIGSSVSFDGLLVDKGLGPAFGPCIQLTDVDCEPVGEFHGKMAVTMRSFAPEICDAVWQYTGHFPNCHGAPLGKNNATELGIKELDADMHGRPFEVPAGTDRLYWACGITPSIVAQQAELPFMISYTPGHAMITDIPTESLYVETGDAATSSTP